jgi:hypothetical protein
MIENGYSYQGHYHPNAIFRALQIVDDFKGVEILEFVARKMFDVNAQVLAQTKYY